MSAVTEHSTCAKNIQPHYNRSDKARERAGETFVPFHFSRFDVITRDISEFRYIMQPSIFPEGVCVWRRRPCVYVFVASILTMLLCFLPVAFLHTRVQVFYGMDDCRVTALQKRHKQPLHRGFLLSTCIHTVPVLIYNHLSRKHFLSHTQYVRTHTHSLMWGRICAIRHTPQGPLLLLFHCQQCKICAGTAEKLGMDGYIWCKSLSLSFALSLILFILFISCFLKVLTTQKKRGSLVSLKDIVREGIWKGENIWNENNHGIDISHLLITPRRGWFFSHKYCFCVCLYVRQSGSTTVRVCDHHRDFVFSD